MEPLKELRPYQRWAPELRQFADDIDADKAVRAAGSRLPWWVRSEGVFLLTIPVASVLGVGAGLYIYGAFASSSMLTRAIVQACVFGVAWAAAKAVLTILRLRRMRRELRVELQKRGVPICIPCGYDLRGQSEARCPECGKPFDPALLKPAEVHRATNPTDRPEVSPPFADRPSPVPWQTLDVFPPHSYLLH